MNISNHAFPAYNWNLIKSFLAVLDEGTLSGAARKLGVSQPTISRHMDELEEELNLTLFERGRRGALPTSAAYAIADHARSIQRATEALSLSAAGKSENLKGTVRITASQIVSSYVLPDIMSRLLDEYPEVEIEIVSSDHVENLLERHADIAIRMVSPRQLNLISKRVNEFTIGVFAHEDYLEKWGTPKCVEDLGEHRMVGFDRNSKIIDSFVAEKVDVDRHFFRLRCDDQVVYWRSLLAGAGLGFISHFVARKNPTLVEIPNLLHIPPLGIWLVSHREVKTNLRIRKVYDFLSKEISTMSLS